MPIPPPTTAKPAPRAPRPYAMARPSAAEAAAGTAARVARAKKVNFFIRKPFYYETYTNAENAPQPPMADAIGLGTTMARYSRVSVLVAVVTVTAVVRVAVV